MSLFNFDLRDAMDLARLAHANQKDKAGRPYIEHIEAVVRITKSILDALPPGIADERTREIALMTAALHDVIEDTSVTSAELEKKGCPPEVIEAVARLSGHPEGVTYMENISALAKERKLIPIVVKLADCRHNGDPERISALPPEMRGIAARYRRSIEILQQSLTEIVARKNY